MQAVGVAWDLLREAFVVGWIATALFCGVAAVAVAAWAGGGRAWAFVAGVVGLYAGLALVLVVAGARHAQRRREQVRLVPPAALATPGPDAGVRQRVAHAWRRWTRTPPTRADVVAAVLAVVVAAGWCATIGMAWVRVAVTGRGVFSLGPFEIQLGLFVVLTALALLVVAAGVVRWRSAWWPVLLAWFATWWGFVVVEVLRTADGALDALNRLLRDQTRARIGVDARPSLDLGGAWPVVGALAVVTLLLALALLALQVRRPAQYLPRSTPVTPLGP